uniref:Uncharacterized protein n=1 Tax=viral metagenome TaxID=1070528 RepID=A0A6C0C6R6_9ZZZZ
MISTDTKVTILGISTIIYIAFSIFIPYSIGTVDPISLSGYLDVLNKTTYWAEFSDKETNMVRITCHEWNKLPSNDRYQITLRFTFFLDTISDCDPYNNQNYQSYVGIMFGVIIINLLFWIVLACVTLKLTSTFYLSSKILISVLNILLLASLYIDVFSLSSTKKLHAMSYGEVYDVKGYLNVSGYRMAINDQFQLSELACKLYMGSPLSHVDVYLSSCSLDNNFLYYAAVILKLIALGLFIPCLIYVGVIETTKPEEHTNLMILYIIKFIRTI